MRGRGFAALTPEQRKEMASYAGKRAHQMGVAHQWTAKEAAHASKRGWKLSPSRTKRKKTAPLLEPAVVDLPQAPDEETP
jgi:hypothetical protein